MSRSDRSRPRSTRTPTPDATPTPPPPLAGAARIDRWRVARYATELAEMGEPSDEVTTDWLMGGSLTQAIGNLIALAERIQAAIGAVQALALLPEVLQEQEPAATPDRKRTARVARTVERIAQRLLDDAENSHVNPAWALVSAARAVRTRGRLTAAERGALHKARG